MTRPLEGQRVLVTRPGEKGLELARLFEEQGAQAPVLPTIEYIQVSEEEADKLDEALIGCARYDAVVFTSFRGVDAAHRRLTKLGREAMKAVCDRRLIAVGSATADYMKRVLWAPDLVPEEFSTVGLLKELTDIAGRRFLLLRGSLAGKELPEGLRQRGAIVDDVLAYRVEKTEGDPAGVLSGPRPDYLTFASPSAFDSAVSHFQRAGVSSWIDEVPMVCIGRTTLECIREHGYEAVVAETSTAAGLVDAVIRHHLSEENVHA